MSKGILIPLRVEFKNLDPNQLYNEKKAADLLGLSPRTLQAKRCKGDGPPYVGISSRAVRYRYSDLVDWMNQRIKISTTNSGVTL